MGNKNRPARMEKKPKKNAKVKPVAIQEEVVPTVVEVVKRKRKERLPDDE